HDKHGEAYMLDMIESRVMEHTWRQWEPHIIYVHHQSGPFPTRIWLPPFSEPVGSDAPYLMSREVNMIGMAIAKGLEERGQVGATHMGTAFDAWYPGYVDYAPNFKNIAAFWTETALFQYATPHDYTITDFPQNMRDLRPQSLYSSPWPPGTSRLRDAVEYMDPASMSGAAMAREVLDAQAYPDLRQYPGGPPERPYDAAGWSLPLQMGVRVVAAAAPLTDDVRAKMKVIGALPEPKVKPTTYEAAPQMDAAA